MTDSQRLLAEYAKNGSESVNEIVMSSTVLFAAQPLAQDNNKPGYCNLMSSSFRRAVFANHRAFVLR